MSFTFSSRLPFLNRPENVARYEDGVVYILDRRVYPFEVRFEKCSGYREVSSAIRNMVTQSYGPKFACLYGMAQAGREADLLPESKKAELLRSAADVLIASRPTNDAVKLSTDRMLTVALDAAAEGRCIEEAVLEAAEAFTVEDYTKMDRLGKNAANLIEDGDAILTHCWADTTIVYTMVNVLEQHKNIRVYCDETRPYLQGARLTANAISEMGIPTTVITDNMPAHVMSLGRIQKFFAGCDRLTLDGHCFNKVGTLGVAICAHHFGIPVFIFSLGPDPRSAHPEDVVNEERNPQESLYCLGQRTATEGVSGYYPAFDVTPPQFISGIVTDRGVFSPFDLKNYPF